MLASYNWLKEFVDFDIEPYELAERLTMQGLEVEGVKKVGGNVEGLVIGQIVSLEKHPNADKLTLCAVDIGSDKLSIVCGASNHQVKDKVVVAKVGTLLPNGLEIKKAKIRKVESFGMLCSKSELNLEGDSEGIWILPDDAMIGGTMDKYLPEADYIYDISLTSNRSDCLSITGIAREIAAMVGCKVQYPDTSLNVSTSTEKPDITINNSELCPRYASRIIKNVKVKESPDWIKEKLLNLGLRPINNVVDITNYVLLELGHPLHAFDLNKLDGKKIIVRNSNHDEKIMLLDESEHKLDKNMLVIADASKSVAVAGVMGGADTEVTEKTQDLLLEAAYFLPYSVRTTSKKLGVSSDSSYRFERGTDFDGLIPSLDRTAKLICDICGGDVSELVDIYPKKLEAPIITVRTNIVNDKLGTNLDSKTIIKYLEPMGFTIISSNKEEIELESPTFKVDVLREIDVVEEIARIHGYDKFDTLIPSIKLNNDVIDTKQSLKDRVKNVLINSGLNEVYNYDFYNINDLSKIGWDYSDCVKIINPLGAETQYLRDSILPSLMSNVLFNLSHGNKHLKIFEIGKIFKCEKEKTESLSLGITLFGSFTEPNIHFEKREMDFYDLKGFVEEVLNLIPGINIRYEQVQNNIFHPYQCAKIIVNNENIGIIGQISRDINDKLKLTSPLLMSEIDLEKLTYIRLKEKSYQTISKFPPALRDLAIVVNNDITSQKVFSEIRKGSKLITNINLIDIYQGKHIPEGKKCLIFSLAFQDIKRTLTDDEIARDYDKIVDRLRKYCDGEMREK